MAIDVHSVKPSVSSDSPFQSTKGSASGSDIDFAELMRNSGARIGNSLFNISAKAGITSNADKSGTTNKFDDRPQDSVDDYANSYDSSDDTVDRASHHDDRPQSNPHDDHAQSQATTNEQNYSEPTGENSTHDTTAHNNDADGTANEQSSNAENPDQNSASDEAAQGETGGDTAETDGQSANAGDKPTDQAANGSENAAATQGKGASSNAEQILHSLLASAQANAQAGQATGTAQDTSQKTGPGENAVKGLTNAVAGATKNATDPAANAATDAAATDAGAKTKPNANAAGKDGFNLHGNPAAQAKGGNAAQTANTTANVQAQTTLAGAPNSQTAAQQAAQLSKMVGDGPKLSVAVETTAASSAVVSKPSTSLTSNAALIGENSPMTGRGHAAQNANGTNAGQAQINAAQVQTQATVIQAATQNQNNAPSAANLKGPAQGALQIGGTGPVAAGGGEGATIANTINTTQQAQQNAATQAANAPRQTPPGQGLTNQVTVQITKAVNAGVDKISIHLKPADLGRVDVKMEVNHDGRVTAVVTADNKNTLDLLQKDSRELQQALQNAGMQMDNDSLSFNLRGQGQEQQAAGSNHGGEVDEISGADENAMGDQLASQPQDIISDTRVDIRA